MPCDTLPLRVVLDALATILFRRADVLARRANQPARASPDPARQAAKTAGRERGAKQLLAAAQAIAPLVHGEGLHGIECPASLAGRLIVRATWYRDRSPELVAEMRAAVAAAPALAAYLDLLELHDLAPHWREKGAAP